MASSSDNETNNYKIPSSYDYSKSTEENYMHIGDTPPSFTGTFAKERSQIDYTFHKHYNIDRQLLQDHIMEKFLQTTIRYVIDDEEIICDRPKQPWLVFTAGCMGAGKGHTIKWLADKELFPLKAFVQVDADALRELLPEFKEYNKIDETKAGYNTQKEVGYISELLTLDGLDKGKNVLVDGSLRDAEWYSKYIKDIRLQFPHINIGILYVTATKDTILQRAADRAKETGRVVPEEVILSTLRKIPESIRILSPLVDFLATFENEDDEPRLVYSCQYDHVVKNSDEGEVCSIYNGFDDWKDSFQHEFVMECPLEFYEKKKVEKRIRLNSNSDSNSNNENNENEIKDTTNVFKEL
jgi:predicted ABC-type ATPase